MDHDSPRWRGIQPATDARNILASLDEDHTGEVLCWLGVVVGRGVTGEFVVLRQTTPPSRVLLL
ncbi:MAG TPA: hypothetical protein PKD27_13265, partial [Tepidiformaceae bacterium]|nr:hypothetical protein [Tepidiformaceae bacterium]